MEVLGFQVVIFIIIIISGFFGRSARITASVLLIFFTIVMVFTSKLMVIQFLTIGVAYFLSNSLSKNETKTNLGDYKKENNIDSKTSSFGSFLGTLLSGLIITFLIGLVIYQLVFGIFSSSKQDSTEENLKKEFPISVSGFKLLSNSLPGGSSVIYSYECKVTITNLSKNTIDKAVFSEILSVELPSGTEQLDTRYTHILNGDKWYPNESKTILINNALMNNNDFITEDFITDYKEADFVLQLVFKASNKFGYNTGYKNTDYNIIYKNSFPFRLASENK